jgi:fluoride exporter
MNYVLVFIGGGIGSSLRHTINVVCARCIGTAFPYGTFIINITGSTVMGLIAGYLAFKGEASQPWRLFLMTGILGGYTTFSAFSLDAALLYNAARLGSRPFTCWDRWCSRSPGCSPASRWFAISREAIAFSSESLPRTWIAGWIPVRVKKTRQNKASGRGRRAWLSMTCAWVEAVVLFASCCRQD